MFVYRKVFHEADVFSSTVWIDDLIKLIIENPKTLFLCPCVTLTLQKFGVGIFVYFWKSLFCAPRLHLFDTVKIVTFYYNLKPLFSMWIYIKYNVFIWSKLYFQHHYSSLQCLMIFRNQNHILKKHFWLLSMLKIDVLLNIFVETVILLIFQDSQMNRFIWNRNLL